MKPLTPAERAALEARVRLVAGSYPQPWAAPPDVAAYWQEARDRLQADDAAAAARLSQRQARRTAQGRRWYTEEDQVTAHGAAQPAPVEGRASDATVATE